MTGRVWLVGAGPSDVGLLTIKAKQVIEQADAVVYDSLVGLGILAMIPGDAEKIDVGKRAGNHKMCQEDISILLAELAKKYQRVVRLKGGDPYMFGRGGEEAELLVQRGIPFEIVPGITSAVSVPAYAGIPVTHRDAASMVHIITGHKKKDLPLEMDFKALVSVGGTLVFLMGVSALLDITQGLTAAGMPKETPAAVISCGTTAREKKIVATIETLAHSVEQDHLQTPAIIVVGEVCRYEKELDWRRYQPLAKKRYLLTRPRERSMVLAQKLRELGAEVIELPAIRTRPILPNPALSHAVNEMFGYKMLLFTSPAAVNYFFNFLREEKLDIRSIGSVEIGVIGAGTKRELELRGIFADYMPKEYYGSALAELAASKLKENDWVLLPRAKEANPEIVRILKEKSITVNEIPLYETLYETSGAVDLGSEIQHGGITDAVFTSASTVRGFLAASKGAEVGQIQAYCIGELTAKEAREAGMRPLIAKEASIDSLVELMLEEAGNEDK